MATSCTECYGDTAYAGRANSLTDEVKVQDCAYELVVKG